MIFKETKEAARRLAILAAQGEDVRRMAVRLRIELDRLPECTMTDLMRFDVECTDAMLALLQAQYKTLKEFSLWAETPPEPPKIEGPK